ncbi:uncharacterized protein N7469_007885 [Penicillium citrinum]|uniref:Uncharacterized protein n=2 Tax=Penicillium TaxID=5073 RepID=A0A9W9NQM6_PENCI|nr:uncharacterized protein N7469_007885 [Penicillium citrinum]KAJ5224382.1 hypothetical protein N7469_007885 [Penicillium citrinum]KAJ5574634.1 hypothetical protein N7450_008533 [Penicillium hetheringtonii]KAK5795937.1 hypothetical protein VI817_005222 [Penicillium citrinum]
MPESFALLRRQRTDDLSKLADQHMQHDLRSEDRDALKSAASTVSMWTTVGSAIGVGLGLYAAIRLRSSRKAFFAAIRAQERPTKVVFADGRTEPIPDLTPLLKPTTFGDFATYFFASAGGLFLGGELGFAGGAASASRTISSDPEMRKRIEHAFRGFRADILRRQADELDNGASVSGLML